MKSSKTGNKTYNRKKWSILFIGEDGKVVTVKHFKGIVTGLAMLLAILILCLIILYYQYHREADSAETLGKDMAGVVAENRSLKDEKDQMLARLVILESKLKAREQPGPPQGIGKLPGKEEPLKNVAKEPSDPATDRKNDPKGGQKQVSTPPAAEINAQVPPISIANKNLIVCQDPTSDYMRVEYKVINTGAKDAPVVGRSIIILKANNMNSEDWIVLPNVPLSDLKPSGERGKRFRIYNFRTIKYKVPSSAVKGRLETATIFTFTEDGTLIMERDYPIEMSAEMCP